MNQWGKNSTPFSVWLLSSADVSRVHGSCLTNPLLPRSTDLLEICCRWPWHHICMPHTHLGTGVYVLGSTIMTKMALTWQQHASQHWRLKTDGTELRLFGMPLCWDFPFDITYYFNTAMGDTELDSFRWYWVNTILFGWHWVKTILLGGTGLKL